MSSIWGLFTQRSLFFAVSALLSILANPTTHAASTAGDECTELLGDPSDDGRRSKAFYVLPDSGEPGQRALQLLFDGRRGFEVAMYLADPKTGRWMRQPQKPLKTTKFIKFSGSPDGRRVLFTTRYRLRTDLQSAPGFVDTQAGTDAAFLAAITKPTHRLAMAPISSQSVGDLGGVWTRENKDKEDLSGQVMLTPNGKLFDLPSGFWPLIFRKNNVFEYGYSVDNSAALLLDGETVALLTTDQPDDLGISHRGLSIFKRDESSEQKLTLVKTVHSAPYTDRRLNRIVYLGPRKLSYFSSIIADSNGVGLIAKRIHSEEDYIEHKYTSELVRIGLESQANPYTWPPKESSLKDDLDIVHFQASKKTGEVIVLSRGGPRNARSLWVHVLNETNLAEIKAWRISHPQERRENFAEAAGSDSLDLTGRYLALRLRVSRPETRYGTDGLEVDPTEVGVLDLQTGHWLAPFGEGYFAGWGTKAGKTLGFWAQRSEKADPNLALQWTPFP